MGKFFFKIFFLLVFILTLFSIYLSYVGIKTYKFDDLIKSKANSVNNLVKLEFQKTKIYLNIKELNLSVKLQKPKIYIKKSEINLSKLNLYLPIKSFFNSDFLLERAEVEFIKNDIKDLTKITNIFLPRFINKKLNKIFVKGSLQGKFSIPFDSDGNIGKNYDFNGKIQDAFINLKSDLSIKNLNAEINSLKTGNDNIFEIIIKKGKFYDLELNNSEIYIKNFKKKIKITSLLQKKGKINFNQIKKISSIFDLNLNKIKDINGQIDLKSNFKFDIYKNFKIKNLSYSLNGSVPYLVINSDINKNVSMFLPDYNSSISFKDIDINLINSKLKNEVIIKGFSKLKENFDSFEINKTYDYNKKSFNINGLIDLTNSKVKIDKLNYQKDYIKSALNFNVNFILNKTYNIKKLKFFTKKSNISLHGLKLNKNFEVINFDKIKIKTFNNKVKNNDFSAVKSKQIIVSGEVFDSQPLLKSLYQKSNKRTFSNKFTSDIKVNFDRVLAGADDEIGNFGMIARINDGSYNKLSLKGNFSENEIVEMSIYQIDKEKKTLQLISDRARPFIKNFGFIEGFEGGKLEYESTILKESSNSILNITNFKVSKVPALAKLLTLASLQGIADTLSGEGIRFDSFEMKSNTEKNILNIEDALAMGPAVSILLDGYIDKGKTVSLRGTLVPATKLNSIIGSIPLIGDILVGNKAGEGIVGVSFKMKGKPKEIKTTVNPIKTLTPRFIVRAFEKLKKKKEKTK